MNNYRGVKMPNCCFNCALCISGELGPFCMATLDDIDYADNIEMYYDGSMCSTEWDCICDCYDRGEPIYI